MAYVLEKISEEDKKKILVDANGDQRKRNRLVRTDHLDGPGMMWAVNRENDMYMFWIPVMREESGQFHYYFYFKNALYEIYLEDLFENLVHFVGNSVPVEPALSELQAEIKAAFSVYGRFGQGVNHSIDVVIPEFKARC